MGYADGPNLYAYVLNDPVNLVDPLGLAQQKLVCQPLKDGGYQCWLVTIPDGAEFSDAYVFATSQPHIDNVSASLGGGGLGSARGGPNEAGGSSGGPIEKITQKIVCAITSFSGGGDIALGFGPVLNASVGFDWNQKTGQVSFQASYSVGYGAALSIGAGGTMSNSERTSGYSKSTNLSAAFGAGLSGNWSSPNNTSVSVAAGKFGFEASKTETKTMVKKMYVAEKGAKCPGNK